MRAIRLASSLVAICYRVIPTARSPGTTRATTVSDALKSPIADGTLERRNVEPGCREYLIPKLTHRVMTGVGWQTIIYRLLVDNHADTDGRYVIESDSEYSGGDVLVCTDDGDEIEAWIQGHVEGVDE